MNRLLGRHDDVFVVRQHENDLCRNRIDRADDVIGRGVHGLTALNDGICAEIGEQALEALACCDSNKAVLFLCRHDHALLRRVRRALDDLRGVLLAHILDLYREERAEFQTLLQRLVRLVGVHVHLYDVIILDHNERVADIVQDRTQTADIARLVLAFRDKFGAVCERDVLVADRLEVRRRPGRLLDRALLMDAAHRIEHSL